MAFTPLCFMDSTMSESTQEKNTYCDGFSAAAMPCGFERQPGEA
jgi:hypothetical protein